MQFVFNCCSQLVSTLDHRHVKRFYRFKNVLLKVSSVCGCFLFSLIRRITVSSLSPPNIFSLFHSVLSIFNFICLLTESLFFAAIRRESVSLLGIPFLSHFIFVYKLTNLSLEISLQFFFFPFLLLEFVVSLCVIPLSLLLLVAIVFLCFFSICEVLVLRHLYNPECWRVLFSFVTNTLYPYHLTSVRPWA